MVVRVKDWLVAVTLKFAVAVCDAPPAPLAMPVTVIAGETGVAMLAEVVMVIVTFWDLVPSSVTLAGLKLQSAPAGRFAVQLPAEELVELVKLTVWVEPFTGAMVKVTEADCPAGTEVGDTDPAPSVKSLTVTTEGTDVEGLSDASPS